MKQFSYGRIFAIGLGFFSISVAWQMYNAFMPLMLKDFIDSSAIRGLIMGLDNLANIFLLPLIGAFSDRIRTPYGKRLPFLMVGMPIAAIFLFMMPHYNSLWTLIAIDIGFLLAMTIFRAPTVSLMPDVTPSEKRSQANGIINFMGGLGVIAVGFGLAKIYDMNRPLSFYITGLVLITVLLLLVFALRKLISKEGASEEENARVKGEHILKGLSEILIKENRATLFLLLAIFFWFIGYSGVEAQLTTYGTENLGLSEGKAAGLFTMIGMAFLIFAIPSGFMAKVWGRTRTIQTGILGLLLVFISLFFIRDPLLVQIILFGGGISWALINIHSYPMVVDMTSEGKIGLYTGLYYLFSSVSQMSGPAILGGFMDQFGGRYLFAGAGISMLIALIFMYLFYREYNRRIQFGCHDKNIPV